MRSKKLLFISVILLGLCCCIRISESNKAQQCGELEIHNMVLSGNLAAIKIKDIEIIHVCSDTGFIMKNAACLLLEIKNKNFDNVKQISYSSSLVELVEGHPSNPYSFFVTTVKKKIELNDWEGIAEMNEMVLSLPQFFSIPIDTSEVQIHFPNN